MKKMYFLVIISLAMVRAQGQQNFNDSISLSRNKLTKNAMLVLGSWSVVNIASGFILAGQTTGETKYAYKMNVYWNLFNAGLAGLGYLSLQNSIRKKYSFSSNYTSQQTVEKIYALNTGLDIAYIVGGFYLQEKGKNESSIDKQDQLKGYGSSIAIQGGFLLLLDAVMFSLHHKNTIRMNNKLNQFDIKATPNGLGVSYIF